MNKQLEDMKSDATGRTRGPGEQWSQPRDSAGGGGGCFLMFRWQLKDG